MAALVIVVLGAVAVYLAVTGGTSARSIGTRYARDWAGGDYRAMYRLLDDASRHAIGYGRFKADYRAALGTATATRLTAGQVGGDSSVVAVAFGVRTRLFGSLHETLRIPMVSDPAGPRVRFSSALLFPGLRAGEHLSRRSSLSRRGTILADDGTPLAAGPGRSSPLPGVANEIVGTLGPIPAGQARQYRALGYPPGAQVGTDGLELIFQMQLAGRPGARLLAGHRLLASVPVRNGQTVRTTIDPKVEEAAISALAGHFAGMTVIDPRTGALLGLAGIAFSSVQPPGSTMKIVTATAALQARLVNPGTEFPVQTSATIGGYTMQNASGEACGGTLVNAFAVSCNSVFAPLGARIGASRLVAAAERFGFNHPTDIPGAVESTIPSATDIGGSLSVASSAIGQGKVQASTLEMADVGATIADGGRRPIPTFLAGARPRFVTVTTRKVASEVQQMMVAVVRYGTGVAAQISGVEVAGKTGTAELANTAGKANATKDTDGWFVGYAPVGHAKVAACALYPASGYGAATAAPAVAQVIQAALEAGK
ncbi:MAG TPA: penicillin-binding transpeptidase domain-containing protein [Solirubrobacteraceae bacterium]|nr:penicillin-binding transpeptidase domain-containing protein [Solirubrobacteraceae bacterium]